MWVSTLVMPMLTKQLLRDARRRYPECHGYHEHQQSGGLQFLLTKCVAYDPSICNDPNVHETIILRSAQCTDEHYWYFER